MMKSDDLCQAKIQLAGPKLQTLSGKPMRVQGHRGGFTPENTLKCFQQALDYSIEGIELDVSVLNIYIPNIIQVWLTKDGIPIILHGGDDGELNHHFPGHLDETIYIFDLTYEQIL
jgi:glycerophosphoryl diester phosphodiesterase